MKHVKLPYFPPAVEGAEGAHDRGGTRIGRAALWRAGGAHAPAADPGVVRRREECERPRRGDRRKPGECLAPPPDAHSRANPVAAKGRAPSILRDRGPVDLWVVPA